MEVVKACGTAATAAAAAPVPLLVPRGRLFSSSRASRPLRISCVGWDPEGILGPPKGGHIARREFQKTLDKDAAAKEAFEKQVRMEKEARRAAREAREVPLLDSDLINFFLETQADEMVFEIARCRPRLNKEFFTCLQGEISAARFSVNHTKETEDRLVELEALNKVLLEGSEAYDKLAKDMLGAKDKLARLLAAKDKKATLLDMVEKNEVDRSLLALLDENIAQAAFQGQPQAVTFMEKIRVGVLRYIVL